MSQNDNFIQSVQLANVFENILDELKTSRIRNPRIHTNIKFVKLDTVLIVYDKFCAILEGDSEDTLAYVALGHNDGENLSHGLLELVDCRMLDDFILFGKGVQAFKRLTKKHTPTFSRTLLDITNRDHIIETVLDTWKLGSEIEMAGGFH